MTGSQPHRYPDNPTARARILQARKRSIAQSLETYWGDGDALARLDALYAQFMSSGDLAFDIGSHVGDRVGAMRRLGANVVAVEAQPDCAGVIEELFRGDRCVTVLQCACGSKDGEIEFYVNSANATVSTASKPLIDAAKDADRWADQVWDLVTTARSVRLDGLIEQHGMPAFVKIDVEGYEAEVLAGLSHPVRALSFEFTTIQRSVAQACLSRLHELGRYRFNYALGEQHRLLLPDWCCGDEIASVIDGLADEANSGDVYAMLERI